MARCYHGKKNRNPSLEEARTLRQSCKTVPAVGDLFTCKAQASEIEIEGKKKKKKEKLPTLAFTAHRGTFAMAGVTVQFFLVQSCEQHQRQDLSSLPIPERWAQGLST